MTPEPPDFDRYVDAQTFRTRVTLNEQRFDRIEERLDRGEHRRRWGWLPYLILAIGMGVALFLVSTRASNDSLSTERTSRLEQDCEGRVEGREVLRIVITEAYAPRGGLPQQVEDQITARRDSLLARVPPLHCVTVTGIPTAVPVKDKDPGT